MDINKVVGDNIRRLREEKGLSLDKLARLTGVSKSMLGQVERGESSPSITVLFKVAKGIKVSLDTLTTKKEEKVLKINKTSPEMQDDGNVRKYTLLTFDQTKKFDMYRFEIESQGKIKCNTHIKRAVEYVTVYSGGISVEINGVYHFVDRGETIVFDADLQHEYVNDSLILSEFSVMIVYYK
jgi:transcriptional regulator with XRE-family HTH domain